MMNIGGKRGWRSGVGIVGFMAVMASALLGASPARAVVVIFDGFGDADINNGIPLELEDADVSGAGDGEIGPFDAAGGGGTPAVFPTGTMVNEVTAVEDPTDRGIRWHSMGRWSSATPPDAPDPRASVHVISDSAGALPETTIGFFHAASNTTDLAEAIDDGLALGVELKGRTEPAAGFFGRRIELGDAVDDEVKVSFDFRIWYSAPNFNSNALNHVPQIGDFRFGLYQDTDNQLGQTNTIGGANNTPAVWGQQNGNFRGDSGTVGAHGDRGWFVRVPIDDPATANFDQPANNIARINEEINAASGDAIMNGNTDFVADLDNNPGAEPFWTNGIDIDRVYNMSLSLKRFDDPAATETTADTIFGTVTITERATGKQWSFGEYERVTNATTMLPDGFASDSWDYFVINVAGQSTSDDFDYLIDNFKLEVTGSNADADFNNDNIVNGGDFMIWQRNFGATGLDTATSNGLGDATLDGKVDGADYTIFKGQFSGPGNTAAPASGMVPEPGTGVMLLAGLVGGFLHRGLYRKVSA
jgi:hypothetical protein